MRAFRGLALPALFALASAAAEPPAKPVVPAEFTSPTDVQAAAELEAALDQPLPDLGTEIGGKAELPLRDLLAAMGRAANVAVLVDEAAAKEAGVSLDDPAVVPVFPKTRVSFRTSLELVLEPSDLAAVNRSGVLHVTTADLADE